MFCKMLELVGVTARCYCTFPVSWNYFKSMAICRQNSAMPAIFTPATNSNSCDSTTGSDSQLFKIENV